MFKWIKRHVHVDTVFDIVMVKTNTHIFVLSWNGFEVVKINTKDNKLP